MPTKITPSIYTRTSPYYLTPLYSEYLDVGGLASISKNADDDVHVINNVYHLRPDMLAYDVYGMAKLWWVFAARNPGILRDPVFDFVIGTTIYVPRKEHVWLDLGL